MCVASLNVMVDWGFKRPHRMNGAFLMKMMWNLLKFRMSYAVEFLSASMVEITILWFLATPNLMIPPIKRFGWSLE